MTERKSEKGFFNKLFGQKGSCCSFQVEEAPQPGSDDVAEEKHKINNIEVVSEDEAGMGRD
ncbi:hypothetical protein [Desulfoferrobacter suflitae]|uniref:hypothetical protein n=1 Tax=Desulfoferrobacter suflitae TaxID=2865782 RepID=UPI0021643703|nr:hypothetical protein [Desulfoferrobacter suflitae]MCK8603741.1 hypothetical protein [Desulfoferrobacter suflitae]